MEQIIQMTKRTVTIYQFTGKVASSTKNMETKVHGGGGGGYSYRGTGGSAPVSITSTTIVHDQLFVVDREGKEKALQLSDFNLACRESNIVTAMWGIVEGDDTGPYFAIINHSTGQSFIKKSVVKDIVRKCISPFKNQLLGCLTAVAVFLILAFVFWPLAIAAVAYVIYWEVFVLKKNIRLFNDSVAYPSIELW